jgi:hypothetical protein
MERAKKEWFTGMFGLALSLGLAPLYPALSSAAVPEVLVIKFGKKTIRGWKDDVEVTHRVLAKWTDRPSSEREIFSKRGIEVPNEGFLYISNDADEDSFTVRAWSTKGRSSEILKAAETALAESIRADKRNSKQEEPVGFVYSNRRTTALSTEKKAPPVTSTEKLGTPIAKKVPLAAGVTPAAIAAPGNSRISVIVLWILLAVVVVLLIAVSTRALASRGLKMR